MIQQIRKLAFALFRKLIPVGWIEAAIREDRRALYTSYCRLGAGSILHPDARIVNFQQQPDQIFVGDHCVIRGELLVNQYGGSIRIGSYASVGESSRIWSSESIRIGDRVHISHNVNIMDGNTHSLDPEERNREYVEILEKGNIRQKGHIATAPVVIEDDVWISFNVTVLKGVTIGRGAVIAANSLVIKDVEPYTLTGGSPAKTIRALNETGRVEAPDTNH